MKNPIAETLLRNIPAETLSMLEQMPISCFLSNSQSLIEYLNPAAEKTFGHSLENVVGQHLGNVMVPPSTRAHFNAQLKHVLYTAETQKMDVESLTKEGAILRCEWTTIALHVDAEIPTGALCMIQNLTDQKNAEANLRRQFDRLDALNAIDAAIISSTDLQDLLQVILQQAITHLDLAAAVTLVFDPTSRLLNFAASQGLRTNALQHTSLQLGEGYAGLAAMQNKTIQVLDLGNRKTDFLRSPNFWREEFKSYVCTPLVVKGEIKGVLEGFFRRNFQPDAEWLKFFETLGQQAAMAIDSVSMFNSLRQSNIELRLAYDSTLEGWSRALDLRDHETENHTRRVTQLVDRMAEAMQINTEERVHIRRGAILHDIGKVGIPDSILLKPGPLDADEWEVMKRHPTLALEMLSPIPYLRPALDIPYCHHEKWDGSGYPRGLKGEDIPQAGRMFAVVDVYDALLSQRPYRNPWSQAETLDYIRSNAGSHFDPRAVEIFLSIIDQNN